MAPPFGGPFFNTPPTLTGVRERPCHEPKTQPAALLTHPGVPPHRSETEMLRYMRKLSDRGSRAFDRAMEFPLGSATMKRKCDDRRMIPLPGPQFVAICILCAAARIRQAAINAFVIPAAGTRLVLHQRL